MGFWGVFKRKSFRQKFLIEIKSKYKSFLKDPIKTLGYHSVIFSALLLISMLSFQNCGNVKFGAGAVKQSSSGAVTVSVAEIVCKLDGETLKVGQKRARALNPTEAWNGSCQWADRVCQPDGSTTNAAYTFPSCSLGSPLSCNFNGTNVVHGGTLNNACVNSGVAFGQSCDCTNLRCYDGGFKVVGNDLADATRYKVIGCSVGAAKSCTLGGRGINHDETISACETSTVAADQTCSCVPSKCFDGGLVVDGGTPLDLVKYNVVGCSVDSTQFIDIPVTTPLLYSPFKLLLIVDDSDTMANNQDRLRRNLDSLLNPLKGKTVDVKLISTSSGGEDEHHTSIISFFRADGSVSECNAGNNSERTCPQYFDTNFIGLRFKYLAKSAENYRMVSFLAADNDSTFVNKATNLKSYITGLGIAGSTDEKVTCPMYKEMNLDSQSFIKSGDKAAVIALTDEDDHSNSYSCHKSNLNEFGPLTPRGGSPGYDSYVWNRKSVLVTFNYVYTWPARYSADGRKLSDGGSSTPTSTYFFPWSVVTEDDITAGTCVSKAQTWLRSLTVPQYTSESPSAVLNFSNSVVTNCQIGFAPHAMTSSTLYIYENDGDSAYGLDLCDGTTLSSKYGNKNINNISLTQNFELAANGPYDTERLRFMNAIRPSGIFAGGCIKSHSNGEAPRIDRDRLNLDNPYEYFDSMNPPMTSTEFDRTVLTKFRSLVGNNYFISYIVNKAGSTCINTGQTIGVRYEAQAAADSTHIKTYSICDSTYSPALEQVSNFIIDQVGTSTFPMNLPTGARLLKVKLNGVDLSNTQYTISNGNISMKVTINVGDVIRLIYAR